MISYVTHLGIWNNDTIGIALMLVIGGVVTVWQKITKWQDRKLAEEMSKR